MPDRKPSRPVRILGAALAVSVGMAGAAAAESQTFPVPKITIYPGDAISADVLTLKSFVVGRDPAPVVQTPDALIGKVARRTLVAGKPIPPTYVRNREVIEKGKPVTVIFSNGGLIISSLAIPLQAGVAGDVLSLRNVDSGRVIKGIVEADGTIRVAGP